MQSLKDNNPEVYEIFSEAKLIENDKKWTILRQDSFSNKTGYNEVTYISYGGQKRDTGFKDTQRRNMTFIFAH